MNVFGKRERSWRKARKRGVSPIIATILLVAITVVLAAVLYVLISGLTHGPGSTPIGSAFSMGAAVSSTCSVGAGGTVATKGCTQGDFIYTLTVETSTVSLGSVLFEVKTAAGGVVSTGANAGGFAVEPLAGGTPACYSAIAATTALVMSAVCTTTGTYTSATPLTNVFNVIVDMGTTTATTGLGYSLIAIGTGSYSGNTAPASLP
ncbi:MAG TPA: archaellin/type IV pilin N-terminal domain-containing protein [Thermoplasmata archaeon]|nr:archaellin/type IV pilin N-terminal domain-containing protein [Thermoplasmata archaeon]